MAQLIPTKPKMLGDHAPRGGLQQRLKRARLDTEASTDSHTVRLLCDKAVHGKLSIVDVQAIAAAVEKDVVVAASARDAAFRFPGLQKLAGLGSKGRYPGNCWKEFKEALEPTAFHDMGEFRVPMKGPNLAMRHMEQQINDPHAMFSQLYHYYPKVPKQSDFTDKCIYRQSLPHTYHTNLPIQQNRVMLHLSLLARVNQPEAFSDFVCPGADRIRRFWEAVIHSPQLQGHPLKQIPNWKERCIPIALHGDGVPCVGVGKPWGKTITVWSVRSLLGIGSTLQCMMLIWAVFKDAISAGPLREPLPYIHTHSFCYVFSRLHRTEET